MSPFLCGFFQVALGSPCCCHQGVKMCGLSVCPMFNQRLANQRKTASKGSGGPVCLCWPETKGGRWIKWGKGCLLLFKAKQWVRSRYQIQGWITRCHWAWPGALSMRYHRPRGHWPVRVTDTEPVLPCWVELTVTAFAHPQPKGACVFYQFLIMFLNVLLFDQWPVWSQFTGIF